MFIECRGIIINGVKPGFFNSKDGKELNSKRR
jgi:hypothetical protein